MKTYIRWGLMMGFDTVKTYTRWRLTWNMVMETHIRWSLMMGYDIVKTYIRWGLMMEHDGGNPHPMEVNDGI